MNFIYDKVNRLIQGQGKRDRKICVVMITFLREQISFQNCKFSVYIFYFTVYLPTLLDVNILSNLFQP